MKKNILIFLSLFTISFSKLFAKENIIAYSIYEPPKNLDPALINSEVEANVAVNLYDRLIKLNEKNEIEPALAHKWETDGKKIVFHIRDDAKWSNGEDLTAYDFFYAFKRVLTPETGASYAYLLHSMNIKNSKEFTNGKVTFDKVGVKALSNKKFELELNVELKDPIRVIAPLLAYVTCSPMNEKFIKKVKDYAKDEKSLLSSGPWMMQKWYFDDKFVLVKNPYYYNKDKITIEKIKIYIIKDSTTAVNMYRAGELDILLNLEKEPDHLLYFINTPDYNTNVTNSATYIEFNLRDKILANKNIRKAISFAINREKLCKNILRGAALPATSCIPYGFSGKKGDFRKENKEHLFTDSNLEKARKLLEIGKQELGIRELRLKLLTGNLAVNQKYAQYIQQELLTKLNITIDIEVTTLGIRIDKQKLGDYHLMLGGWRADYPGYPTSFLDRLSSSSTIDFIKWNNKKFDALIKKAENAYSHEEKVQALFEAEKLVCDEEIGEFPMVPILFPLGIHASKPNIKNVKIYTGSYSPDFRSTYIENR